MRAVITGDWHIGISTYGVQEIDGVNSRTRDVVRAADEIIDYAIANKVDRFIHLGDVWHRNHPHPTDIALAIMLFNRLEQAGIYTFVLAGNHDYVHGPRFDAAEALGKINWKYVRFYSDPVRLTDGVVQWVICPHTQKKKLDEFLDDLNIFCPDDSVKQNIVLAHTMFQGCIVGSEDTMMATGVQMIPREMTVDAIFSGHIHKAQILERQGCAPVYHPGSPMCMDFGERNDAKEFMDVMIGDQIVVNSVPVKYQRRFIHLDNLDLASWPDLTDAIVRVEAKKNAIASVEDVENEIKRRGAHAVASIKLLTEEEQYALDHQISEMVDDKVLMANFLRERCPEQFDKAWAYSWEAISATG